MSSPADGAWRLAPALRALAKGGVVAYPTEAVFGLGCDPLDGRAVGRILELKRRSPRKGLILVAHSPGVLEEWLAPAAAGDWERVLASWPGPVTWILRARPWVPGWLTGGTGRLAVRVTAHPIAGALARAFGAPLVSTSANRAGAPPARAADEVRRRLGPDLDCVVAGDVGGASAPSEIRDLESGTVVRAGSTR